MLRIEDDLIKPFVIIGTKDQYTVGIPKMDKQGEELIKNPKYFYRIAYALQYIVNQQIVDGDDDRTLSLKQFSQELSSKTDLIINTIKF